MATLADLIGGMTETPEDMLYARPLMRASQGFQNVQIKPNRNYSTGDVFALEALKGLGGGITGALGDVYSQRAESQMAKQKLSQALAMQEIQAQRDMEKMALEAGLENGTVSLESLPKGFSLSEAMSPDFSNLPLTEDQKTVIPLLKPKDRPGKIAEFVALNTKEEGRDKRNAGSVDKAIEKQKALRDEKPEIELVGQAGRDKIALQDSMNGTLEELRQDALALAKKGVNAFTLNAKGRTIKDSDEARFLKKLKYNAKVFTTATEGARPSDYDSKTYATVVGDEDYLAGPLAIAKLTEQLQGLNTARKEAVFNSVRRYYGRGEQGRDVEKGKPESPPIPEQYEVMSGKGPNGFPLVKDRKTGQIGEWQ